MILVVSLGLLGLLKTQTYLDFYCLGTNPSCLTVLTYNVFCPLTPAVWPWRVTLECMFLLVIIYSMIVYLFNVHAQRVF